MDEIFNKWVESEDKHDGTFGNNNNFTRDIWVAERAFRAGYETAMKEVEHKVAVADRLPFLFDAIKHGDDEHKRWLHAAIISHFNGWQIPESR